MTPIITRLNVRAIPLRRLSSLPRARFVSSNSTRRQQLETTFAEPQGGAPPPWATQRQTASQASDAGFPTSTDPLRSVLNHDAASIILRDACKCTRCVDKSDRQRDFHVADIPPDIEPASAVRDESGNLVVKWRNDMPGWEEHVSVYTPAQLRRIQEKIQPEHHTSIRPWDRTMFERNKLVVNFDEYMNSDRGLARLLHAFAKYGLVYIEGVPEDERSVTRIAERIAALRQTFYGPVWDVRSIPNAINVAFTSKHLGFHSDLMYLKEPPNVQFLHCLHNSSKGGESRFVDQMKALDVFITEDPENAQVLMNTKLRYEYDNDGHYYTDIKPIVQQRSESHIFPRRAISGATNDVLSNVHRMFWGPQFLGSVVGDTALSAAAIKKSLVAMKKYASILEREELVYTEKMKPATCVVFDNLRVLHARNEFDMNSGKRWLRGTYIDGQDLWDKEISLSQHITKMELEDVD